MGWEAIEQYLIEVEREVKNLDQQVPQMIVDGQGVMQQTTDFYTEELMHNKPIQVFDAVEQSIHIEERPDLCDLDREDSTFYPHQETFTNLVTKTEPAQLSNFGSYINTDDTGYIKTEPGSEYPEYSVQPDCAVPDCISNYCYSYTDSMEEQYRTMKSQVFDLCTQDVLETCKCLNISPDPYQWNHENVQHWIVWQCRQYREKQPNLDHFYITGSELCSLSENEFKIIAPESCSMLSSRLSIWKSVVEQMTSKSYQTATPSPVNFIPVPRSPCVPSSPDSVSSNPAMLSDTESQPSSPPCSSSDDNERLPNEPVNHHRQTIQLWQFLKLLLLDGGYTDCIRWVDRSRGIFKIENSSRVAKLWGRRKNRPAMNYDKLSRSIRQYYKKNIIKKTEHSKRLVYQFCHM